MKNAAELDHELEKVEYKGFLYLPDRPAFSARMIAALLNAQCPLSAVCLKTIQEAIKNLRDKGAISPCATQGNAPYFDRFYTEVILFKLKFKVKNPCQAPKNI
jgi:hypothetical protein